MDARGMCVPVMDDRDNGGTTETPDVGVIMTPTGLLRTSMSSFA